MSSSEIFIGETIGTAILILLGGGVCAAVTLKALKASKARDAGRLAIAFGWGFAVLTAVCTAPLSDAHLDPGLPLALTIKDGGRSNVPVYWADRLLGAMIGATLVWVVHPDPFRAHLTDPDHLVRGGRRRPLAGRPDGSRDRPGP